LVRAELGIEELKEMSEYGYRPPDRNYEEYWSSLAAIHREAPRSVLKPKVTRRVDKIEYICIYIYRSSGRNVLRG
jgi:hypothetical protein